MNIIANDNSTMVIIASICNDDDCTNYNSSPELFSSSDSGGGGGEQGVGEEGEAVEVPHQESLQGYHKFVVFYFS